MLRHQLAIAALVLGALLHGASVDADNQNQIERLKIEANYDACTTEKTLGAEYCANETWNIEVNDNGWSATSIGTDGAPPVLESRITCADGKYKSITNGQPWLGKCELIGDPIRPCFHISGGGSTEAFSKVETMQCFEISGDSCTMTLGGEMIGQAEAVKGEYAIALKEINSCRVSQ